MSRKTLAAVGAALMFAGLSAAHAATLEFDGLISQPADASTTPFTATYSYDPSGGSSYTNADGDVVTTYIISSADLSFGGHKYPVVAGVDNGSGFVTFDQNKQNNYEIFEAVAGVTDYNFLDAAEIKDGVLSQGAGSALNLFGEGGRTVYGMTVTRVSATPEPSTWAFVIAGVALAGAILRRRRPAAASAFAPV